MYLTGHNSITRRAFNAVAEKAWLMLALFPWRAAAERSCCPFQYISVCPTCGQPFGGGILLLGYYYLGTLSSNGPYGACGQPRSCQTYKAYAASYCCGLGIVQSYTNLCCEGF